MEQRMHGILKKATASELQREGYTLFFEPAYSPLSRLEWSDFRPDIMGFTSGRNEIEVAFAECETSPRPRRVREKTAKIQSKLSLQKCLGERHGFRLLLVIPCGTLARVVTSDIREVWEIWIGNDRAQVVTKIPRMMSSPTHRVRS